MRARSLALGMGAVALAAALHGCAAHQPSGGAAPVPAPPRPYAATLLGKRCGSCHAVPDPAAMTGEKWIAALERMKVRMTLPAADWDSLAALAVAAPPDTASVAR